MLESFSIFLVNALVTSQISSELHEAMAATNGLSHRHNECMQVDIYSFGVVLWEIATQEKGVRGHLRQTRVPEECPAEIESLIDRYRLSSCTNKHTAEEKFASSTNASCSQSGHYLCTIRAMPLYACNR